MGLASAARRAAVPAQRGSRALWERRGTDRTAQIASTSALVVAPHADDETLGCAVTIMRKRAAGSRVRVLVVSDGAYSLDTAPHTHPELVALREQEARTAAGLLGVAAEDVSFGGLPDGGLAQRRDEVRALLERALAEERPEQLLVPVSCDGHPDHDAVSRVAAELVADLATQPGEPPVELLEYPVWMWTHWPFTSPAGGAGPAQRALGLPRRLSSPRPYLVSTAGHLEQKRAVVAAYKTQVEPYGGEVALSPAFLAHFLGPWEVLLPGGSMSHLGSHLGDHLGSSA
ncbi:LmbE family N-acetylglucosaminyl deacetylase [Motilibacter rhizosphaerae]|uniref:LmbE family N-acetylglucosaminyl deacetylase n=1 Tax=Motilibacter rhizosphaerae TaxID=598652 RepID=A0A4Q7NQJ6_9ACTN|nr:PIG-L family deacetylase [Motilibacter rhizosphaerae]RZS87412.1 LmbE family N-acetylglucosaminyl deacetylase [Motilibacter rhizosphaerae]